MKTPPLLLGATLLFWGWQAGFVIPGVVLAVVLEGARFVRQRWDFSDDDFSRIWTFCTVLFLALVIYAFTDNGGPARFSSYLQNTSFSTFNSAGTASARTASAILRWLPMVFFLFVAAQAYGTREEIPLTTISLILRRRWKRAEKSGRPLPPPRGMNVAYPFFAICLFAASIHASENNTYFLGLCALLAWSLWSRRTRRFGVVIWSVALAVVFVSGYFGQHGLGQLQSYLQNLDTQWLARFIHGRTVDATQNRTALGRIGNLKTSGQIVIRLETRNGAEPPPYLREASYRFFVSPNWKVSNFKEDRFDPVQFGTTNTMWILLPERTDSNSVRIACYLDGRTRDLETPVGFLPLPTGCSRLENLSAFTLRKNGAGAVIAEGPGLVIFDAFYGPGATADAPPAMNQSTNEDLLVPPREMAALNEVIGELHLTSTNTGKILQAVNGYFESKFTYSTWQKSADFPGDEQSWPRHRYRRRSASPTNETALARFLLKTHSGHCEYFATATVLLLRQLGIPARYAVGYAVHESSGRGGFVVRERDAHAWCLVWDERAGRWLDFDTTPAIWVDEESKQKSTWQKLSDFWSWLKFQFSKFRWGQTQFRRYLVMVLVPVLVLLFAQIFLQRSRRRRLKESQATPPVIVPGRDSEFYLIERKLLERGASRDPNEPLSEWLERVLESDAAPARARDPLRGLLRLHYRYRFDPRGLTETDREELKRGARSALDALEKMPAGQRN